jgi:hypothetical protein
MRVLYVGDLAETSSSLYRFWAIGRLGHEITSFDTLPFLAAGGRLARAWRFRTLLDASVNRANRRLLKQARDERPDIVLIDKGVMFSARTITALNALGCVTISYNQDNPFGPRGDPGWRLFRQALPHYRLHLVPRDSNVADYRAAGAQDVKMLRFAYEPSIHFPPPEEWSDADRKHDVVFIGAPYDRRAEFMTSLWREHGIAVKLWGAPSWSDALAGEAKQALWQGGPLWIKDYRETIWRARVCLSFVTHSNVDDVAHRSFEIAACGGFLLAEDTPGHRAHFAADEEAVFFGSASDCAGKIRHFLGNETARRGIAAAGRRRAVQGGYGTDDRMAQVLDYVSRTYFAHRSHA